jgi:hypothetical protein
VRDWSRSKSHKKDNWLATSANWYKNSKPDQQRTYEYGYAANNQHLTGAAKANADFAADMEVHTRNIRNGGPIGADRLNW